MPARRPLKNPDPTFQFLLQKFICTHFHYTYLSLSSQINENMSNVSIFPIKVFLILNSFLLISLANFYRRLPRRQNRPSATITAQRCKRKFSGFGKRYRNYVMIFEHRFSGYVRGSRIMYILGFCLCDCGWMSGTVCILF